MSAPTQAQIAHINQHLDRFHGHAGDDRTPEEYLHEYSYIPDIYERLCNDLGIEPIQEETMTEQAVDIQTLIQNEVAKVAGQFISATTPPHQTFEDVLAQVDPADSDAALGMLDWLLKTGRLGRVGVLDGGQGYLFMYQEPKGSTKQGYKPGATQGDRIVDEAVEAQRAAGKAPAKRGMCPHCYSVVVEVAPGEIVLDDDSHSEDCASSPTSKHDMA